jgi:hypothetical protein
MVVCRETKEKKRDWSGGLVGVGLTRTLTPACRREGAGWTLESYFDRLKYNLNLLPYLPYRVYRKTCTMLRPVIHQQLQTRLTGITELSCSHHVVNSN